MKKFCLRHWRGDGEIIADVVKGSYRDYPKDSMNRNARSHSLAECIVQILSKQEYLAYILVNKGVEYHNKMVKKHQLGDWNLVKEDKI